jgi:stage II sporulation protein D
MSALGRDSGQILAQYFPGATVADEATGQSWQTLRAQGFALRTLTAADGSFLPQLTQALAEAEARSGLQPVGTIAVSAFRSTTAFRDATLAPGWVAAFTEGNSIATQPLATLAARNLLIPVLRHEFLHALVECHAAPGTPLWLREGLAEAWSDANEARRSAAPVLKPDEIDRALAHVAIEAESETAHKAAAWYARRLLDRHGREQVVAWLHSGLPPTVIATLR